MALRRLPHAAELPLPAPATAGAAGADLAAAITSEIVIPPGGRALIPTGFAIAVPLGFEAQIRPRSGLALHHGVALLNSPGTIDSDYRGEIGVILINLGSADFRISRGMRVAQIILAPVAAAAWQEVVALPDSPRGAGGFGSTGVG